jgi:predicted permease
MSLTTRLKRIFSVFRRDRYLEDLRDEMDFHIATRAEKYMAGGMNRSDAFTAARQDFGSTLRFGEQSWYQWASARQDEAVHDIRYAARLMIQNKGWTAIAVLSLALGIGANAAIFSVFDALLLKSLPVKDPEQLVALRGQFHYPFFQLLGQENLFLNAFATSGTNELDVEIDNASPERAPLSLVSGAYFSVLGVPAVLGRTFTVEEDQPSAEHPVAVLSYGYWQRRFARDPAVVGKSIRIRGTAITIIGVAMPGFFGENVGRSPDVWLPLSLWPRVVAGRNLLQSPGTAWLDIIGRRRPDAAVETTEAVLTSLFRRYLTATFGPAAAEDDRQAIANAAVRLVPADKGLSNLREQFSHPIAVVFGVVALMLLIACANVANLLLARAETRRREIGLRLALGIGRGRLIRQLLTENLLLAAVSSAAGVWIAYWGNSFLLKLASTDGIPITLHAPINGRVLFFVAALSVTTATLFGLAPMWQSARLDLADFLRDARSSSSRRFGMGGSLIVVQVAISLVLLMGAGLFLKTLSNLRAVDLGFEPEQMVIIDVNPRAAGYEASRLDTFADQILEGFRAVAGASMATFSENGALMGRNSRTNRLHPDDFVAGPEGVPSSDFDVVGPDYFATMGIALVAGRDIFRTDTVSSEAVIVINQAMARRFFPGVDPVGRRMRWNVGQSPKELTVIGVAPDVKQNSLRGEAGLRFYLPYFQLGQTRPTWQIASIRLIVRTSANEQIVTAALRQSIRSMDPRIPILSVNTGSGLIEHAVVQERMVASLSTLFAAIALVLTCVGLYGLMSYRVARRTKEIGIRLAIGSSAQGVIGLVVREALNMILAGTVIGVAAALAISRLVRTLLFGLTPYDSAALAAAVGLMILVSAVAAYLPAMRASRVAPLIALRND